MFPEFCSQVPGSPLSRPYRHGKEIIAGNGWLAIRCHSGRWIDSEFPEAPQTVVTRFDKLPWKRWESLPDDWKQLDRGLLLRRGEIGVWLDWKPAPSPIWMIGEIPVRLSFLQMIARLPRLEVAWLKDRESPLFFRFSGGRGIIARHEREAVCSNWLFQPITDRLTGAIVEPQKGPRPNFGTPPPPEPPLDDWPPVEPSDEFSLEPSE